MVNYCNILFVFLDIFYYLCTIITKINDSMEKTRTFGRSELAQQYFPQLTPMSAWRKFKDWLEVNPQLRSLLTLKRRTYTPAEVQLIYSELGEP